jgi:hypothetical protein
MMRELFIFQKKIKYIFYFIIFFTLIFHMPYASAEQDGTNYRSVLKFCSGIVAAFSIHELSHAVVAELTNTKIRWEAGTYNQPIGFTEYANSDLKGFTLNSAGLLSQAIGSEIVLRRDGINKNNPFVQGFMTWNILNPILYSLDYWLLHSTNKERDNSYQGDLEGIEHYSNEATAHGFAFSMTALAIFQGYRFLKTQTWAPDWLKSESHNMSLEPKSSGGFLLKYKVRF